MMPVEGTTLNTVAVVMVLVACIGLAMSATPKASAQELAWVLVDAVEASTLESGSTTVPYTS